MNPRATKLADEQLYKAHPELKGRPLTMDPKDAKLRAEWMASYKAADAAEKKGLPTCAVGGALAPCPLAPPPAPPPPAAVAAPPPAPPPPPSCKVEVRASKLSPVGYYHLFIVFTDAAGKEFYLRGGPSGPGPGGSAVFGELSGGSSHTGSVGSSKSSGNSSDSSSSKSSASSRSSGSSGSSHASGSNPSAASDSTGGGGGPYGTIETEYGDYVAGTIDWDPTAMAVTVESGAASCGRYSQLITELDAVTASNTRYNPVGPNSNSTVFTALSNVGITPSTPADVWAPGSGTPIKTK